MPTRLNRLFRLYARERGKLPEDIAKLLVPNKKSKRPPKTAQ